MLKPGLNRFNRFLSRNPGKKYRSDSYWTGVYPSPEPSILAKAAGRISNRIYSSIDSFFTGTLTQPSSGHDNNQSPSLNPCVGYCQVWELNQDISDIALKDIEVSLHYIFPAFFLHFLNRFVQYTCLFFQTDFTVTEESPDLSDKVLNFTKHLSNDSKNKIIILQRKVETKFGKLLLFNDWIKELIRKLNKFLKKKKVEQPYYLLGNFAPQKYEYDIVNQSCMIRGPDKPY